MQIPLVYIRATVYNKLPEQQAVFIYRRTKMNVELRPVLYEEKAILANLLEKYCYEFSQYDNNDVNQLGLYGYKYLDYYWTEENRWAYFIIAGGKLAGVALVNDYPEIPGSETDFSLAEFFVLYKYRRQGIGKKAFFTVLDRHKGNWQLMRHPKNIASVHFWNKAIAEYTGGQFELIEGYAGAVYDDGTPGDIFIFRS